MKKLLKNSVNCGRAGCSHAFGTRSDAMGKQSKPTILNIELLLTVVKVHCKAYQEQMFKLPWADDFAEKRMG